MWAGLISEHRCCRLPQAFKKPSVCGFTKEKEGFVCVCARVLKESVTTGRVVYVKGKGGVENDGGDSGKKGDQNKEYILLHLSCSLCWRLLLLKWRTWSGTFFWSLKRYLKKEKKKRNEWMDKPESGLLVPEFLEPALVLKDGCAFIEGSFSWSSSSRMWFSC